MIRQFGAAALAGVMSIFSVFAFAEGPGEAHSYEPMAVFAPFAGKTLRGEGTGPDGQPIVDIAKWEFILNGRAFQSTHRLENGDYGGRTIFFYDEGAKEYVFHYFTTAGFHTTGTITPTENGFTAVETVKGHPKYQEVRSEMIIDGDKIRVTTAHIDKDGEVHDGDGFVYSQIEDPGALFGDAKQ
ncbi:MAG: hypothetical protein AAGD92_01265 [Pseudomonadota bacterium]